MVSTSLIEMSVMISPSRDLSALPIVDSKDIHVDISDYSIELKNDELQDEIG